VVDIGGLASERPKNEPALQLVDCVASAVYKAIDEDNFGEVVSLFIETLAQRFIRTQSAVADYGFKLLPDKFKAPLSSDQKRSLKAVGYDFSN
jgi:hypothetical protein